MGVIGIGVGTAKMGRICRDKDGNITEQSTARWDVDPDGGSVAIWPMDPEKMEPSGPAEVYGDWDAAAYLRRVVELKMCIRDRSSTGTANIWKPSSRRFTGKSSGIR